MKRTQRVEQAIYDALLLTIDTQLSDTTLTRLAAEIERRRRESCWRVVSLIPDELWHTILGHGDALVDRETALCCMSCVCQQWNRVADRLIRAAYEDTPTRSRRVFLRFTHLQSLDLHQGVGDRVTTRDLLSMSNLTSLSLGHIQLSPTARLGHLTGLVALSLHRQLALRPDELAPLTRLTRLAILQPFINISDASLSTLTNLVELQLPFTGSTRLVTEDSISRLCRLRTLDLSYNHTITGHAFAQLTNLCALSLRQCTSVKPSILDGLTALTFLDVVGTPFVAGDVTHLTNLRVLCLSDDSYGLHPVKDCLPQCFVHFDYVQQR
jgi:hypothetical protein